MHTLRFFKGLGLYKMRPKIVIPLLEKVFDKSRRNGFCKLQVDNLCYNILDKGGFNPELVSVLESPYTKLVLFYTNDYYEDVTVEVGRLEVELSSKDDLFEELKVLRAKIADLRENVVSCEDLIHASRG